MKKNEKKLAALIAGTLVLYGGMYGLSPWRCRWPRPRRYRIRPLPSPAEAQKKVCTAAPQMYKVVQRLS